MRSSRHVWWIAGLVAGFAGLATSYFVAMVMTIRESPVVAVAELVIKLTPGPVAERAIRILGHHDKQFLVLVILLVLGLLFAWAGRLAQRSWWQPLVLFAVIAGLGALAVVIQYDATLSNLMPVLVGFLTWVVCLALLTEPLRGGRPADEAGGVDDGTSSGTPRRGFVVGAGLMVLASVGVAVAGRILGSGRRHVEEARRLIRLPGVSAPTPPAKATLEVPGITPWRTPTKTFYQVHTALVPPAIEPAEWQVRIHGLVDRELVLTYDDLLRREFTEGWITLNCVSNPVGGPLIGNAWWSGVALAGLLHEVGVHADADALLQTSQDGWTCGTPLAALTRNRKAMLAVAMNGQALPIEHGFPVRTLVPGLYGYVSACKWVVDLEVTRFEDISAYWVERGWAEQAPVKISSRIDVPRADDEVESGRVTVAGVAWAQHTGISAVEVSLDGGPWELVGLGKPDIVDAWVQWATTLDVGAGDHVLRVRATGRDGEVQTGAVADVLPDGATGWHTVEFTAN